MRDERFAVEEVFEWDLIARLDVRDIFRVAFRHRWDDEGSSAVDGVADAFQDLVSDHADAAVLFFAAEEQAGPKSGWVVCTDFMDGRVVYWRGEFNVHCMSEEDAVFTILEFKAGLGLIKESWAADVK